MSEGLGKDLLYLLDLKIKHINVIKSLSRNDESVKNKLKS